MDNPSNLGQRLKAARLHAGLTQTKLAIEAGTTATHVMDIENGDPGLEGKLVRIAASVGVNPHWLETGEGSKDTPAPTAPVPEASKSIAAEHSKFAAQSQASGVASLIVALGDEVESLSSPARSKMNRLLQQLVDQPHNRHDLAMEVTHVIQTT